MLTVCMFMCIHYTYIYICTIVLYNVYTCTYNSYCYVQYNVYTSTYI